MEIYLVGGAVRDALMGSGTSAAETSHFDRDWVVVGGTPQSMMDQGFLPVGRDFPVFLHPTTREEYALARTERKTAPGYHGFAFHAEPGVTLEADLARRDLTINAMAVAASEAHDPTRAQLIDPYGGQRDLQQGVLRHVTEAFAEDPVRILRLARFAARFPDFTVAPETQTLMRQMVEHGEVDHLVPERVWQELSRGLMEQRPSRLFNVLRDCGALERLLPEVDNKWGSDSNFSPPVSGRGCSALHSEKKLESDPHLFDTGVHLLNVLDLSARLDASLPVRFACLCHNLDQGIRAVCKSWRVPRESRELAEVVAREHGNIHRSGDLDAAAVLRLLERCDALRRPERFGDALLACECDARGHPGFGDSAYPQRARLLRALAAALTVNTMVIAQHAAAGLGDRSSIEARAQLGPCVAQAIHAARAQAVADALGSGAAATPG